MTSNEFLNHMVYTMLVSDGQNTLFFTENKVLLLYFSYSYLRSIGVCKATEGQLVLMRITENKGVIIELLSVLNAVKVPLVESYCMHLSELDMLTSTVTTVIQSYQ